MPFHLDDVGSLSQDREFQVERDTSPRQTAPPAKRHKASHAISDTPSDSDRKSDTDGPGDSDSDADLSQSPDTDDASDASHLTADEDLADEYDASDGKAEGKP